MHLVIAIGYLILLLGISYIEKKKKIINSESIFIFFFMVYLVIPPIIIHGLIFINSNKIDTGNFFFDRVYNHLSIETSLAILLFTSSTFTIFYIFSNLNLRKKSRNIYKITLLKKRSVIIVASATILVILFLTNFGSKPSEIYGNLVLFRSLAFERTALTANVYSALQTFAIITSLVIFIYINIKHKAKIRLSTLIYIFILALFIITQASRRAFIIPTIILLSSYALYYQKIPKKLLMLVLPISLIIIAFGELYSGTFIYGTQTYDIWSFYNGFNSTLLNIFSEIGISQIQSFAVFEFMQETPLRFGQDIILSIARRFPEGILGIDIDWPERIVRISTTAFTDSEQQDIPPGLIGQAWLDFGIFGFIFWGMLLGLQINILKRLESSLLKSPTSSVVIVIIAFLIAMPINTGSYDFTFSVDIFLLIILLAAIIKIKNVSRMRQAN